MGFGVQLADEQVFEATLVNEVRGLGNQFQPSKPKGVPKQPQEGSGFEFGENGDVQIADPHSPDVRERGDFQPVLQFRETEHSGRVERIDHSSTSGRIVEKPACKVVTRQWRHGFPFGQA